MTTITSTDPKPRPSLSNLLTANPLHKEGGPDHFGRLLEAKGFGSPSLDQPNPPSVGKQELVVDYSVDGPSSSAVNDVPSVASLVGLAVIQNATTSYSQFVAPQPNLSLTVNMNRAFLDVSFGCAPIGVNVEPGRDSAPTPGVSGAEHASASKNRAEQSELAAIFEMVRSPMADPEAAPPGKNVGRLVEASWGIDTAQGASNYDPWETALRVLDIRSRSIQATINISTEHKQDASKTLDWQEATGASALWPPPSHPAGHSRPDHSILQVIYWGWNEDGRPKVIVRWQGQFAQKNIDVSISRIVEAYGFEVERVQSGPIKERFKRTGERHG